MLSGLLYFLLFSVTSGVGLVAFTLASHGVLAECNGPLPHPPHPSLPRHKPLEPFTAPHRRLLQEPGPYPAPSARNAAVLTLPATLWVLTCGPAVQPQSASRRCSSMQPRWAAWPWQP